MDREVKIAHGSAAVSFETYQNLLAQAKTRLPFASEVVFLADRGFADTQLMGYLRDLGWHFRIRIKSNFWIHPTHLTPFQVGEVELKLGHMSFWHGVAMTNQHLVSVGTSVVQQGKRRLVDPHWFRGASYLKIGWHWVRYARTRCYELITTVYLSSEPDPEPAMASKKQDAQRRQSRFVFEYQEAARK